MDTPTMLLVPLLLLGVVMAFAFAGCGAFGTTESPPSEAQPPPPVVPPPVVVPPPDTTPPPTHPAAAYRDAVMVESTKSLRSYWRLGEAAGETTAADSDPVSPRPGSYRGNPTLGVAKSGIPGNQAEPNTAATFDGVDDHVEVPYLDPGSGALTNPPGTFTLEAWIRPEGPGVVLSSYSFAAGRGFVLEVVAGAPNLQVQARLGIGGATFKTVTNDLGPGTSFDGWRHVVVTYENPGGSGIVKVYVNAGPPQQGPPGGANYSAVKANAAPPLRIGAGWNEPQETGPGRFFKGRIDEVALYDKVLTPAEITAHFDPGKQP